MFTIQCEPQRPGVHQFLLRDRIAFQLLAIGRHLLNINSVRCLVSGFDHQTAFRIELLIQPDRHLVESRGSQNIIQITNFTGLAIAAAYNCGIRNFDVALGWLIWVNILR